MEAAGDERLQLHWREGFFFFIYIYLFSGAVWAGPVGVTWRKDDVEQIAFIGLDNDDMGTHDHPHVQKLTVLLIR